MKILENMVTVFELIIKLFNPCLNHLFITKKEDQIMNITCKFSRFWALLLPVALLAVFFKYLHQLNSILTSIEGVGFRKTLLVLFLAFFAIWSFVYLSSIFFVRAISWIWKGTASTTMEKSNVSTKNESKQFLTNNIEGDVRKEREKFFRLDLPDESVA